MAHELGGEDGIRTHVPYGSNGLANHPLNHLSTSPYWQALLDLNQRMQESKSCVFTTSPNAYDNLPKNFNKKNNTALSTVLSTNTIIITPK